MLDKAKRFSGSSGQNERAKTFAPQGDAAETLAEYL
jgi:hypothetical protein